MGPEPLVLPRRLGWLCPRVLPHKMIVGPELRPDVVCEEALAFARMAMRSSEG